MVHIAGLEPARDFSHYHLKVARLPIPPYVRERDEHIIGSESGMQGKFSGFWG